MLVLYNVFDKNRKHVFVSISVSINPPNGYGPINVPQFVCLSIFDSF